MRSIPVRIFAKLNASISIGIRESSVRVKITNSIWKRNQEDDLLPKCSVHSSFYFRLEKSTVWPARKSLSRNPKIHGEFHSVEIEGVDWNPGMITWSLAPNGTRLDFEVVGKSQKWDVSFMYRVPSPMYVIEFPGCKLQVNSWFSDMSNLTDMST